MTHTPASNNQKHDMARTRFLLAVRVTEDNIGLCQKVAGLQNLRLEVGDTFHFSYDLRVEFPDRDMLLLGAVVEFAASGERVGIDGDDVSAHAEVLKCILPMLLKLNWALEARQVCRRASPREEHVQEPGAGPPPTSQE